MKLVSIWLEETQWILKYKIPLTQIVLVIFFLCAAFLILSRIFIIYKSPQLIICFIIRVYFYKLNDFLLYIFLYMFTFIFYCLCIEVLIICNIKIFLDHKKYKSFKDTYKYTAFAMVASLSYPNPQFLKGRLIIFCVVLTSVLPLSFLAFYDLFRYVMDHDITNVIQQTNLIGPFLAIFFKILIQNYNEQPALQMINEINRDYEMYNDLSASYWGIVDNTIKNSLIYSERGWIVTVLSVVLVFPFMAVLITLYSHLIKHEEKRVMIHDIRTPYGSDEDRFNSPYFEIMFAYMLYAAVIYIISFIGYDGFFGLCVNHACLKMKIYCKMFEDALVADRSTMRRKIRNVIIEQNRLFRFVDLIQETFNIWLGLILVATMIQTCNCMYTLSVGNGFDLKYIIFIIGTVIHIFLPCLYSAKLKDMSVRTATLIYCAGWEDIYETDIRKGVQFMIARLQVPLEIVAFNIKVFDMDLFVSILQTSYSVYTLIRS